MKEYSIHELRKQLDEKSTSAKSLAKTYLDRIQKYDAHLNSVSEINPEVEKIAAFLDEEMISDSKKSILHGIPCLLKDNINTKKYMHTTASSYALSDLVTPYDATVVTKLKDAGALILGKANLSEFAYFMSYDQMPSGYGSLNGQVKNPYNDKIDPLGSSTGSAVAVAANLIPFAIGTETNGSLMAPAYQNGIVAIKPSFGLVSRYGIIPISETQDMAGPMARSVEDCALVLASIVGPDENDPVTTHVDVDPKSFLDATRRSVKGLKIGMLYYSSHALSSEEKEIMHTAKDLFKKLEMEVTDIHFETQPIKNDETLLYEFKNSLNKYLESVSGFTKMSSLSDIIAFNKENKDRCLKYGQSILEAANQTSGDLNDEKYLDFRNQFENEAIRLEQMMIEQNLDALVSTIWTSYAPIAGNPSICVPAKPINDLSPISLIFVGPLYTDAKLIAIAHQYEINTKHRIPPKLD
jgi:amidase